LQRRAAAIDNKLIRPRLELLEPRLCLSGTGLTGQCCFNDNFTGLADTRTEAVAQNWGSASPGSRIDADTFSVRWTGQVQPRFTAHYTFTALSDKAVRVWVAGQLIVDDWLPHTARYCSGSIDLVADQLYDIRVDYPAALGDPRNVPNLVEPGDVSSTHRFRRRSQFLESHIFDGTPWPI
jgi:hypothetical protein